MSIKELCRLLGIHDATVTFKICEAGISDTDELLEVAPNESELLANFGISDQLHRRKIVAWMLKVPCHSGEPHCGSHACSLVRRC